MPKRMRRTHVCPVPEPASFETRQRLLRTGRSAQGFVPINDGLPLHQVGLPHGHVLNALDADNLYIVGLGRRERVDDLSVFLACVVEGVTLLHHRRIHDFVPVVRGGEAVRLAQGVSQNGEVVRVRNPGHVYREPAVFIGDHDLAVIALDISVDIAVVVQTILIRKSQLNQATAERLVVLVKLGAVGPAVVSFL